MVEAAKDCEMVIFLDKTARPLVTLFDDLWSLVYPGSEKPQIKFLNIGNEKIQPIENYYSETLHHSVEDRNVLIDSIKSKKDLEQYYGEENVVQLLDVLRKGNGGRRLIIDETSYTGKTQRLAERITKAVDPNSSYSYFNLLDSDEDKKPFVEGRAAFMPWHELRTLVSDKNWVSLDERNKLFHATVEKAPTWRKEGLQVRQELKMLAQEAVKEYASSHHHSATS